MQKGPALQADTAETEPEALRLRHEFHNLCRPAADSRRGGERALALRFRRESRLRSSPAVRLPRGVQLAAGAAEISDSSSLGRSFSLFF